MAKAGLDNLDPETADQARFIIQAQDLIDPEHQGQHCWLHMIISVSLKLVMLLVGQVACLFGNIVMPYVVRNPHAGGALWRKKALALLQSADEDHADTAEVLKWAETYFGAEKWQKWKGLASCMQMITARAQCTQDTRSLCHACINLNISVCASTATV